jgi:hypothetical protein
MINLNMKILLDKNQTIIYWNNQLEILIFEGTLLLKILFIFLIMEVFVSTHTLKIMEVFYDEMSMIIIIFCLIFIAFWKRQYLKLLLYNYWFNNLFLNLIFYF